MCDVNSQSVKHTLRARLGSFQKQCSQDISISEFHHVHAHPPPKKCPVDINFESSLGRSFVPQVYQSTNSLVLSIWLDTEHESGFFFGSGPLYAAYEYPGNETKRCNFVMSFQRSIQKRFCPITFGCEREISDKFCLTSRNFPVVSRYRGVFFCATTSTPRYHQMSLAALRNRKTQSTSQVKPYELRIQDL